MGRGRPRRDILTPREWEVLALLREGLTNSRIAVRLGISENTAKYHVTQVFAKLGVSNREEAAAWQPERQKRWLAGVAPLAVLREAAALASSAKVAAGGILVVTVAALVLLAVGLMLMHEPQPDEVAVGGLGKIAYVVDGDLWVKSLPNGTPRRITSDGTASYPRWSASGRWLLIGDIVWSFDGKERHAAPGCVAWSPLADELACVDPATGITLRSGDGSVLRTLGLQELVPGAGPGTTVAGPHWSPDGTSLAYAVVRPVANSVSGFGRMSSLWVISTGSTDPRLLYQVDASPDRNGGELGLIAWSPDGSRSLAALNPAYSASLAADGLPLYSIPLDGSPPLKLVQATLTRDELMGGFSSSGALALSEGGGRNTWTRKRIELIDAGGGQAASLTDSAEAAFSPAWSPDGRMLAYVSAPDEPNVVGGDPARAAMARRRIWIMNADGTQKHLLTDDEAYRDERPMWSADGSQILFARIDREGGASLWLIDAGGGRPAKVADVSKRTGSNDAPLWFGFYGFVPWDGLFAWWRG